MYVSGGMSMWKYNDNFSCSLQIVKWPKTNTSRSLVFHEIAIGGLSYLYIMPVHKKNYSNLPPTIPPYLTQKLYCPSHIVFIQVVYLHTSSCTFLLLILLPPYKLRVANKNE